MVSEQTIHSIVEVGSINDLDSVLVRASKSGDADAFGELVKKYQKRVFRIARTITRSSEDAEDICQNVFAKAWGHLAEFEERASFSTWLTRIAVNESLMQVRRRQPVTVSLDEAVSDDDEGTLQVRDLRPNPEELYSDWQVREMLSSGLARLRPAMRIVFVLRDMEGLSIEETAAAVGATVAAVKTRLFRARLILRAFLEKRILRRRAAAATIH